MERGSPPSAHQATSVQEAAVSSSPGVEVGRVAASAVVVRRDRADASAVLIVRRRARSSGGAAAPFAGQWVVPGGLIAEVDVLRGQDRDRPEVARRAAARELREETGIDVPTEALDPLWVLDSTSDGGQRYRISYFETCLPAGQRPMLDRTELEEFRWVLTSDAVEQAEAADLDVPPATLETLRRLCRRDVAGERSRW
jgi:8-oxo-dGTP pyrophosphatase MutT (NUDIX family)